MDESLAAREQVSAALSRLAALSPGWLDGQYGDVIDPGVIAKAGVLAYGLHGLDAQPRIYPTPDGGVSVEWEQPDSASWSVDVEASGRMYAHRSSSSPLYNGRPLELVSACVGEVVSFVRDNTPVHPSRSLPPKGGPTRGV